MVDTAPAYRESEKVLGELMAELGNRERLFLATKVTAPGGSVDQGRAMIEESFRRLQTARIDLLQVHNLDGLDVLMPELQSLKRIGRIRYIGVTTSRAEQYPAMLAAMRRHPLDFIQVNYSLGNRGAAEAILPLARQRRQAVLVNLPFGGRREQPVRAGSRTGPAALGRGVRRRQLGAAVPEVRDRASGRHRGDPRHDPAGEPRGQRPGGFRRAARRGDAAADRGILGPRTPAPGDGPQPPRRARSARACQSGTYSISDTGIPSVSKKITSR